MQAGEGDGTETRTKSVLCMPIYNNENKVIGVAQMINKRNADYFSEQDRNIFEAFAIFSGLGIHNTQMYEMAEQLMAKQKVALEVLSYHATAQDHEVERLSKSTVPLAEEFKLYEFEFSDLDLTDDLTCLATIRMFIEFDLLVKFSIPYEVMCRWVLSVKKNYRPVTYHNWRHAFNVTQTMFTMMKVGAMQRHFNDLELLGLLVACLCHDLDHRGTNNAFQTKTTSPLATLYGTSTMEHHHFDHSVMILNSEGNNIFQALSSDDYRILIKVLEHAILSTDLALYFKKKGDFVSMVEGGERDFIDDSRRELLRGMMMTACDVSAISKPWKVQRQVAELVSSEFFEQGDLEKNVLHEQPIAMMDREKKDDLPKMQVGFIDAICIPVYKKFAEIQPNLQPLMNGVLTNRHNWQTLAEENERKKEGRSVMSDHGRRASSRSSGAETVCLRHSLPRTPTPCTTDSTDNLHSVTTYERQQGNWQPPPTESKDAEPKSVAAKCVIYSVDVSPYYYCALLELMCVVNGIYMLISEVH
ncbi:PREDICTED: cGMP-specific 3',5'-cyclic phosphodiesterase-like [Priapulus caudatus]|uniref:Phosphodiesterase n=1 Tax=Priapulus caudatus TaxID=37621 RepID=A0ABM1E6Y6_PRICU|nr:PREDICTED: cGMP-specific 3',5'-cyclic phosphodiesterase-like [Priapulus caudatus]